jgi:hypothetical protein
MHLILKGCQSERPVRPALHQVAINRDSTDI